MLRQKQLEPIQMLWVRGDLSRMELLSLRSFLAQGHPVHLYTYDAPTNLPAGVDVLDARDVVPEDLAPNGEMPAFSKGSYGAFSDFFRYRLLFERGGWWSDLDVVAIRPWAGFPEIVTASTNEQGFGIAANGFAMRFPAGHEVLRKCLEALPADKLHLMAIDETGPQLLQRVLGRAGVAEYAQLPEVFAPVPWNAAWQSLRSRRERFSLDELKQRLRRPHLSIRLTKRSVAVHLWNEMWRHDGIDKNTRHHPTCLYEKLQRRFSPAF